MPYYLCSYRPLIRTKQGREAIVVFNLPKYIDGSCRREPDFENPFPSITALCRFTKFAPRLQVEDKVVYITKKGIYPGVKESHWRLTAILRVKHRFLNHIDASQWYTTNLIITPRNCMVDGNPPVILRKTDGLFPVAIKTRENRLNDDQIIRLWDASYHQRAVKCGVFLVCEAEFLNLINPPDLKQVDMLRIFGKIPGTQNPPKISLEEFEKIRAFCN
jgi:hypothetical protein